MSPQYKSAQSIWFNGVRDVEIRHESIAPVGKNEIQVSGICSLISQGSEMNYYRGESNLENLLLPTAAGTPPFPVKFAYQTVGEIVDVGDSGSIWEVGDRVFCSHPHQSLFNIVTAPSLTRGVPSLVRRVPGNIESKLAVFAGQCNVALNSHLHSPVRVGDCVAVSGLGVVGSFTAHLARKNARHLVLIDPSKGRRQIASWIGADAVVHPDDAADAINNFTDGQGVDLFMEVSGAPAALQMAIRNTVMHGRIDVSAWYGSRPVELMLSPEFHLRCQQIHSSHVHSLDTGIHPGWDHERAFQHSFHELEKIGFNALETKEYRFSDAVAAYQQVDMASDDVLGVLLVHEDNTANH